MRLPLPIDAPGAARPATAPAAVLLDLDGTCLDSEDQFLHPRVREAVREAARRVPVIVATGRMYRSALPWCRELGIHTPLVCYQGALVRELPEPEGSGAVLLDEGLASAVALRALHVARAHNWHFQAYQDDELYCEQDRPEAHLYARIAGVPINFVDDLAPLLERATSTKAICVIEDPREVERCIDTMTRELQPDARVTRSLPQFVEIVSPLVSKAAACALVCERLGVRMTDAIAIGDAPNDIEMLDAAGFAIVVSNAVPSVLAHADATCNPPCEAGVADALAALGLC
ncbi:MAG TPA: HAD-IIB family hydrolase [Candidatus Acidoferrales bacterium]|nr:HAD-IIB family hydrolase [Candidatus Acidoferrales bacterium]